MGAEETTDEARLYTMRSEARHYEAFKADEGEELRPDAAIRNVRGLEISERECQLIDQAAANAEALEKLKKRPWRAIVTAIRLGPE